MGPEDEAYFESLEPHLDDAFAVTLALASGHGVELRDRLDRAGAMQPHFSQ